MTHPPALSRLKLLGLALAFLGPPIIAAVLYLNPQLFAHKSDNYGELISPAQSLAALDAVSRERGKLPDDLLTGKWTLLYWNGAGCDLSCEAGLFIMRQVRLSLNKDMDRVQTVYLSDAPGDPSRSAPFDRHPQLTVAYFPGERNNALRRQMRAYPKNGIYIVDPLGNLMMRYPDNATSRGVLKDLKKLLRVSRIG